MVEPTGFAPVYPDVKAGLGTASWPHLLIYTQNLLNNN